MDRIGEYLIKRMVGEGGMGKVYEAEERLSGRKVALKVLRPELARNEDGRRLFLNEMQILAHLEHPNVVRSLASIELDGQLVMVLEYLQGHTLREELTRRGKLPWSEAVDVISRIAEALGAAHGQEPPIVHRDLKPENVMLTENDAQQKVGLKVMDFGIAKVLEAVHATNTQSIGTLQYMSPEQIDAHTIDPRSDLYSLGLIFYELVAGTPPFHSASPRELLNMQCTVPAPDLPDEIRETLPQGVETLLFELLEKSPDQRPASASEVLTRLSPFRVSRERALRPTTSTTGSRRARGNASDGSRSDDAEAAEDTSRDGTARSGDTLHSTPHKSRTDTIALVERASLTRELTTGKALVVIAALSLCAGVATYMVRSHANQTGEPAATATGAPVPAPRSP